MILRMEDWSIILEEYAVFFNENNQILDELSEGIFIIDRDGCLEFINKRALELLNYQGENPSGRHITTIYKESELIRVFETGLVEQNIRITINKRNCLTTRVPIFEGEKIVAAMAIFEDLTIIESLNSKLEAEHSEMSILKTVLELAYDGILVVDIDGYITMISDAYKKFLGVEGDEVIGKHVTNVIENTRMHIVAKSGIPEINDFQEIRGDYMVATRIPYYVDGKQAGAIGKVIFRNINELEGINKKYNKIEMELRNLKSEISNLHRAKYTLKHIITVNNNMNKLKNYVRKISKTRSNVLIQGESGTGKELIAHAVHNESLDRDMPFVSVNCAAIPEHLLESELFGYEKGAFTGADKNGRIGKFEIADQGTIFLDEIGDMPLQMQAKILRVIQEGEVERVGSNRPKHIDVRVIAATNKDLKEMIELKTFREDLYYRLNVINILIPPLRDRKEDIPLLAKHFLEQLNDKHGRKATDFSEKAQYSLSAYNWKGNIRELRNVVERAYNIIEKEELIQPYHLPMQLIADNNENVGNPLKMVVEETEKRAILERLIYFKGNKTKTANDLGISRMALHKKIEKYELG